jgi:hypothetical protein
MSSTIEYTKFNVNSVHSSYALLSSSGLKFSLISVRFFFYRTNSTGQCDIKEH